MPLTLIEGQFRIVGAAPDGDSIRFYPTSPNAWNRLDERVRTNHSGGAQLRLEGIDALETHYQPQRSHLSPQHQPSTFANGASAELLTFLGFEEVVRGTNETVTSARPESVPGFILSRFADTYGRAVAFVFPGNHPNRDGSSVFLDVPLLRQSGNYHLLDQGLVYPTFYSLLYHELRAAMGAAASDARKRKLGLWAKDASNAGFELTEFSDITDNVVILPKLFRRLLDYLAIGDGDLSLAGFRDYVEQRNDRLIVLPSGQITGFDFVVEVIEQRLRLTEPPENLVFIEK